MNRGHLLLLHSVLPFVRLSLSLSIYPLYLLFFLGIAGWWSHGHPLVARLYSCFYSSCSPFLSEKMFEFRIACPSLIFFQYYFLPLTIITMMMMIIIFGASFLSRFVHIKDVSTKIYGHIIIVIICVLGLIIYYHFGSSFPNELTVWAPSFVFYMSNS